MTFRILIVDDSALVRETVKDVLGDIPGVIIEGEAADGQTALAMIEKSRPDLVILDIEMPKLDGLSLLKELRNRKIFLPVLVLSVLTQHGAETSFQALELGALDFVPKPAAKSSLDLKEVTTLLKSRVLEIIQSSGDLESARKKIEKQSEKSRDDFEILFIGSSTGGPQALHTVFRELSSDFPVPILIVQHMPPVFTKAFAERLHTISALNVVEAEDGMPVKKGTAYVAAGNRHMLLDGSSGSYFLKIDDGPAVHAHRPSIDVTLNSIVSHVGGKAVAALMTGMGRDGVSAMEKLHQMGGITIAQDEQSSVIFGMNRRAIEAGVVDHVVSVEKVVATLDDIFHNSARRIG